LVGVITPAAFILSGVQGLFTSSRRK